VENRLSYGPGALGRRPGQCGAPSRLFLSRPCQAHDRSGSSGGASPAWRNDGFGVHPRPAEPVRCRSRPVHRLGCPAGCEFTYTLFPGGTIVPTFGTTLSKADAAALDQADRILGQCGQDPAGNRAGQRDETGRLTLPPEESRVVANLPGPGAITRLKLKVDLPQNAESQQVLLRQLTLTIRWNGETAPAVWAPLGDFFGTIGGSEPHRSLPVGMMEDGTLYCYWYMPFERRDFPLRPQWSEPGPAGRLLRAAMDRPPAGRYGNGRSSRGKTAADRRLCRKACARGKSGSGDRFHPIATGFRAVIARFGAREP
jgi:hypothetical protein